MKIFDKFFVAATKKKTPEALIFSCHIITNVVLLWLMLKWYVILKDFLQLDSVHYHDDVVMILKSDLPNLKILMSG